MDEENLRSSLNMYKLQLSQVESALTAAGDNNDLNKLKTDLHELINLTEGSLLSFLKSKLLSQLDATQQNSCPTANTTGAPSKDAVSDSESLSSDEDAPTTSGQALYDDQPTTSQNTDLNQIIGTKCRAVYSHSWGDMTYHNGIIASVEPVDEHSEPKVKVLFTQPTHRSLVPCQYYLDDRCSYGELCKFSHGHTVEVRSLREYIEPDHGNLKLESQCLAKSEDGVWYPATIVEVCPDHRYQVMFDKNHEVATVQIADVVPLHVASSGNSDAGSDCDVTDDVDLHASDEDDDALPVYLWRPGQCNDVLADWEKHTKGVGSRLMRKMGYIMGQGLGINQEGRVEPVPIQLLPAGKSLDKIMELKELAGNRDIYDVNSKHKRKQEKIDSKAAKAYEEKNKTNVFDFLNKKLENKKGDIRNEFKNKHSGKKSSKMKETKHISHSELKNKSEKGLNIQLFQTAEEISSTQRQIVQLKSSLSRNKGEPLVAKKMTAKIASLEKYVQQLKSSESSIQRHKTSRTDHKKLSIF